MASIYSWNVNSINARLERFRAFVARTSPDVICLQELKCEDERFPADLAPGYHVATYGQRTYNGVAILAKQELRDVKRGFDDPSFDDQARFISAKIGKLNVVSVYCPNGQSVGSDKYQYKLIWFERFHRYLRETYSPEDPLIILGDFNVAPDDRDVHDPEAWRGQVLCSEPERDALRKVTNFGLVDTFRLFNKENGHFSWWDFRTMGFPLNRGVRIDLILATDPVSRACTASWVERRERKGDKPSDHAPVGAMIEDGLLKV